MLIEHLLYGKQCTKNWIYSGENEMVVMVLAFIKLAINK